MCFDIEVDELDPDKFINVVAALEPTFGGINLEEILKRRSVSTSSSSCAKADEYPGLP
ncbi:hypothetical protein MJ561_21435 [Klebsiella pneumoniae]|nr:hypothetical protein MJ561_21435 [Klebsiella pneumoniae]